MQPAMADMFQCIAGFVLASDKAKPDKCLNLLLPVLQM